MGSNMKLPPAIPAKHAITLEFDAAGSQYKELFNKLQKEIQALHLEKLPSYHGLYFGGAQIQASPFSFRLVVGFQTLDRSTIRAFVTAIKPFQQKYKAKKMRIDGDI